MITDQDLIKLKKQDIHTFKKVYNHYMQSFFLVCLRYLKNKQDAEDVLQEGFLTVFQKIYQYKGNGSFEGWMKRIFINKSLEHLRKQKRTDTYNNTEDFPDNNNINEKEEEDLKNFLLNHCSNEELYDVISQLPDKYRVISQLFFIEQYKHEEIAQLMNIKSGTSKVRLLRAKKMLSECYRNLAKKKGLANNE